MSPFLTQRGVWLLISSSVFILLGALLSEPVVLFLGEVQVAVLGAAFMLLVPGAIALDRRHVTMMIEDDGEGDDHAGGLTVGEREVRRVRIENASATTLYAMRATPFGAAPLELTALDEIHTVPAQHAVGAKFFIQAARCGRWVIQGFDVRITDPLGLIETRDYLPALKPVECYPRHAGRRAVRLRAGAAASRREGGRHQTNRVGMGTDIRELREHQPGDPLRNIAWKATVRRGKLISRNFEQEIAMSVYVLFDISSSMRGGQQPGQKLEHGVELIHTTAAELLARRDSIGLITFDEDVYGHVTSSSAPNQIRRILHHLAGLNSIVRDDLTELDEDEVEAMVVDYLLVQERLDFRKGEEVDPVTGINADLLRRWLGSILPEQERKLGSPVLREGAMPAETSRVRRFAQLRGLEVPYRVEARLGTKERGLHAALEEMMHKTRGRHTVLVVSDLCGIMNLDALVKSVRLAQLRGHRLRFIVPFTPSFYDIAPDARKERVLLDLFSSAEREERMEAIRRLRAIGATVEITRPNPAAPTPTTALAATQSALMDTR